MSARELAAGACVALASALQLALRLAGWSAVTLLATLGLSVVALLMLGNFEAAGFFAHLANLADRFAAADPARRAGFLALVLKAGLVLFLVVAACRWNSLAAVFRLSPKGSAHA